MEVKHKTIEVGVMTCF